MIQKQPGPRDFANAACSPLCLFNGLCLSLRSHGTTKRSASRPLGEESYPSVALGNLLLARTLVILMVAHALGCMWILEQPKGSVMELHPLFQEMMGKLTMWKHTISMGRYGANSDKPTWLYASITVQLNKLFEFVWLPIKCPKHQLFTPPGLSTSLPLVRPQLCRRPRRLQA